MKNLHVLPTDKPSRYVTNYIEQNMQWQNIYLTSEEEITGFENNIWVIKGDRIFLWQNTMALVSNNKPKKIILTTDQDLIKDGVQAIDDEFLEWFVKNPSCEQVEVEKLPYDGTKSIDKYWSGEYKIIIPQGDVNFFQITVNAFEKSMNSNLEYIEEPKQETLEDHVYIFDGAKWQQEQNKKLYSEEEVLELLRKAHFVEQNIEEWFKQFKKK